MPQVLTPAKPSSDPASSIDALLKQYRQANASAPKPAPAAPKPPLTAPVASEPKSLPIEPKPVTIASTPTPVPVPEKKTEEDLSWVDDLFAEKDEPTVKPPASSQPISRGSAREKEDDRLQAGPELNEENIRKQIEQLEKQLQERKLEMERSAKVEKAMDAIPEKPEVLKETTPEVKTISKPEPSTVPATSVPKGLEDLPPATHANLQVILKLPIEDQVKILTKMVYHEGLYKAVSVAEHLGNPYLLDLLHDTLVDELYQKLKGPKIKAA